jgi:hypothetical protein
VRRLGAAAMSGAENEPEPPGQKHTSAGEVLCKKCGGGMLLATVLSSDDEPRLNLFRCLACDFYDLVKP